MLAASTVRRLGRQTVHETHGHADIPKGIVEAMFVSYKHMISILMQRTQQSCSTILQEQGALQELAALEANTTTVAQV